MNFCKVSQRYIYYVHQLCIKIQSYQKYIILINIKNIFCLSIALNIQNKYSIQAKKKKNESIRQRKQNQLLSLECSLYLWILWRRSCFRRCLENQNQMFSLRKKYSLQKETFRLKIFLI
ncbi:hypothetical protein TTHERM_000152189 (macronuclear) [Tetrahymena thermophila SB210]|uniref:Uncharacterized protein n=1 Tax=Tetrahymena thermophila (strain SB210) TaxID=312017 RepID=W7X1E6_TETTS|nr:hypothetical protein TTHERM_000152189 [Tetrahymena thermophila SB210]EWS73060.1 hypothetical protein TTHERM_000152189 [Tetrahymena thermophila SB210]|eukprot:XP_012654457.1 hypothetical protein TTHERM_000152189 [Tetrahymena thermophila SB210]